MFVEFVIFVVFLFLLHVWWNKRPEGFPPGPSGIPLLGYLPFMTSTPHVKFAELAKKYGPIFSLKIGSRNAIVLNDYNDIQDAFKEEVFAGRGGMELLAEITEGRGVSMSEGKGWMENRRFILRNLRDFGFGKGTVDDLIHEELKDFCDRTRKRKGKPVSLKHEFNIAIVNAIWQMVTGERLEYNDKNINNFIKDFSGDAANTNIVGLAMFMPWLPKYLPWIFSGKKLVGTFVRAIDFLQKYVMEHKQTYTEEYMRDLIDVYLREIKETTDPSSVFYKEEGMKQLRIVVFEMFIAGSDTVSTTLNWGFMYLILNPDKQQKLREELDRIVGRDRMPSLKDRPLLPYAEATMSEILRLSSIAGATAATHRTFADTEFRSFKIPKGTLIMPNFYNILNDPKQWDRPKEFIPERFLTQEGKFKKIEGFIPFGTGKRVCLGESLARDSLFLYVSTLVQQFICKIPPGHKPPSTEAIMRIVNMPLNEYQIVMEERQ